jgi:outer membrane protein OmpA-like peptidoglycan-associated protein
MPGRGIALSALVAGLAACAGAPTRRDGAAAPGESARALVRGAELARVRCLLVAPVVNASNLPEAGDAANAALLANVARSTAKALPPADLVALFRRTPFELPDGIDAEAGLQLAQILGADAVLSGVIEGRARGTDGEIYLTLRIALAEGRQVIFASAAPVQPIGETPAEAITRVVKESLAPASSRLGSAVDAGVCFDPARLQRIRALALERGKPPEPAVRPANVTIQPAPPKLSGQAAAFAAALAAKKRFVLEGLVFRGRSPVIESHDPAVTSLASAMRNLPEVRVRLEGFVDRSRDGPGDAKLSMEMAVAVRDLLMVMGIPKERVTLGGRAGARPRFPNASAKGRAANRRVEAVALE